MEKKTSVINKNSVTAQEKNSVKKDMKSLQQKSQNIKTKVSTQESKDSHIEKLFARTN